MLTDYLSCYKLNNKSIPLPRREKCTKNLKIVKLSMLLKFWGIQILVFIIRSNRKQINIFLIFHTCNTEKVGAYHTGSAFTQYITHAECHSSLLPAETRVQNSRLSQSLVFPLFNIVNLSYILRPHADFMVLTWSY